MSAQNQPRRGRFSAIVGVIGFSALSGLLVTVMVAPALAVTGITASSTIGIFDSLPEYIEIGQLPERNEIWANYTGEGNINGQKLIATIYDQNREEVAYDDISPFAIEATIDGEDSRFYEHGGVDIASVVRAAVGNLASSDIESGASTLSMQLVKNIGVQAALELDTDEERQAAYADATDPSFERKLKEMKLAIGLEKKYTKKEILTAYLNIANFGNATYGIQAAAQRYYSVDAKDLTLPQAASLIAIVQYPNQRNLGDPENYPANRDRRDFILGTMLKAGDITQQEHDEAVATPVDDTTLKPSSSANGCIAADTYAKWFCDYVVKSVKDFAFLGATEEEREANWTRGGYTLYGTLDLDVQIPAQDATWAYAPGNETAFALGSATSTVQAGTGRVLVMAENKDFDDSLDGGGAINTSAVNYNTSYEYGGSSGFQPGSTYKIFTLLDWLNHGKGVNERVSGDPNPREQASRYKDRCNGINPGEIFPYKNNAGERGTYTIRDGTVNSVNGVFFSMAKQLDLCDIRDVAASLGVERADGAPLETNPTSIIGTNTVTPLSMASAYAGLAALGNWCKPIIIDRVILPSGEEAPGQPQECKQVLDPAVAATAIDVLKGVMRTGNQLYSNPQDGIPIFGKTGTTDSANQTWMASATTTAATVTWVGNSIGDQDILQTEYAGVSGIRLRHYIMNAVMTRLDIKYGGGDWPPAAEALLRGGGAEVPDVRGLTPGAAQDLLESLGFYYEEGGPVDSDLTAGVVATTNPAPGEVSAKGATVTVSLSRGNKVSMIDVVGDGKTYSYDDAKATLKSAGFDVDQDCETVEDDDPSIDKVIKSDPSPGSSVARGADVTLTVAKADC